MTLETAEEFNNPPVVYDAFGRADDSESVSVGVLDGAYDPDGSVDDLDRGRGARRPRRRRVDGAPVRANRAAAPKVVPFRVEDGDGACGRRPRSTCRRPGPGIPYVEPGALIELERGGSFTGRSVTTSSTPRAEPCALTGKRSVSASPAHLSPRPTGSAASRSSADADYRGPGALLRRGHDGDRRRAATRTRWTRPTATPRCSRSRCRSVTTPRCSSVPRRHPDLGRPGLRPRHRLLVHRVDPRPARRRRPELRGTCRPAVDGSRVGAPAGSVLRVSAAEDATRGGEAVLTVQAGTEQRRGGPLPPRRGAAAEPARRSGSTTWRPGESAPTTWRPTSRQGVSQPDPTVVSVDGPSGNSGVRATQRVGPVTLTAATDARGGRPASAS